ncbi:unnamed protein product [Ambrosiozyma monospora]|uniref:Unnamed protein product n=1 Tax=Ambrosiozyma monospora TaxID=43982 RepID=A0A9W6YPQ5_AMBMO|nr:unnamed protein product [Ambrosiozyma monospora]
MSISRLQLLQKLPKLSQRALLTRTTTTSSLKTTITPSALRFNARNFITTTQPKHNMSNDNDHDHSKCSLPGPVELESTPIEDSIRSKITQQYAPTYLKIRNDSWKHAGHRGLQGHANITESHFHITIISDAFNGVKLPARHRGVYKLLSQEMNDMGVHALQLKTKTAEEWSKDPAYKRSLRGEEEV